MEMKMQNPAAPASAHRVPNSVALHKATQSFPMPLVAESLAVAMIANRYRLARPTARMVCELAGLGGRT